MRSLTNFNFSGILASGTLVFVATGVLVSSGNGDKAQGSAFVTFLLQIRVSAEVRKFTVMVFTLLNFPTYTNRQSICTSTFIKTFIPSVGTNNFIPVSTYGTFVPEDDISV